MKLGLDLQPIIDRLSERVSAFRRVGGAAEYEQAIAAGRAIVPCAFVLPARDTGDDNPFQNQLVQQEVTSEFGVLIGAQNLTDMEGAAAHDALVPLRRATAAALLGWSPGDEDDPADGCEYRRGEIRDFVDSQLWWIDVYSTRYIIRSA